MAGGGGGGGGIMKVVVVMLHCVAVAMWHSGHGCGHMA
jgi:hypothetical protein